MTTGTTIVNAWLLEGPDLADRSCQEEGSLADMNMLGKGGERT
jgi:hypothetical protein